MHTSEAPNDYFALVLILEIIVSFYGPFWWMSERGSVGQTTGYHFGEEQQVLDHLRGFWSEVAALLMCFFHSSLIEQ